MSKDAKPLWQQFLDIAKPDEHGWTRLVPMAELESRNPDFRTKNGGDWCRSDGPLREFNILRKKEGGRIVAVQLQGHRPDPIQKGIRPDIVKEMRKRKCVVLAVSAQIQVDHKNGRYNATHMASPETQHVGDFQPLHQAANSAKRSHCKECKATGVRFDARVLGYAVPQWVGGEAFTGNCIGCFWYDPLVFNKKVSESYKKPYQEDRGGEAKVEIDAPSDQQPPANRGVDHEG